MTTPLPHGLQVIAEAAGVEVALEIALARGGSRLTIPQKAEGSILVDLVGIDAARKIVNDLSGERIEIPSGKRLLSDWLRDKGWSQERRAMKLRTSRRTVQYWDSGNVPSLQTDLFDKSA
ncbi:MAG: hypothetical protein COW30_02480 [Rhodospirillales bacterium CG15_BIG_FIL_POST_REV_8_21_14_020_66_15]|nr:MAG: hypothetical protein COW30_02480 [Rhodospirillales bacterium CG15_BIG_FIL_POST_REV_8_21_14_020_66_15]